MNRYALGLTLALVATLLWGCNKPAAAPATTPPTAPTLPTTAQPKLRTMKIYLGAEVLDAELAVTPTQIGTGMMFRTNLTDADAMLFALPFPQRASFWMMNCPESLSAAYINPQGVIQEIRRLEAHNTNSVIAESDNILYVLEVKESWFDRHNVRTGMVVRTERGALIESVRYQRP